MFVRNIVAVVTVFNFRRTMIASENDRFHAVSIILLTAIKTHVFATIANSLDLMILFYWRAFDVMSCSNINSEHRTQSFANCVA